MVATDTNRRNNQISVKRGEPDEQDLIWCWVSSHRVECLVQQVSKNQTNYSSKINLGRKMSASLEMLVVKLGVVAAKRMF